MDRRLRVAAGSAWAFILLMGIVSMFSDMTHESANSILGAFLSLAGASATTIGFVSGLGMCLGYALRLFSGWLADRTHQYWTICIVGYILDLIFVPLLALVPDNGWVLACSFVIMERVGKALKKPSKDTLMSFAAKQAGAGKSFGIQEFLDQLGAFLGPIILYAILLWQDSGSLIQDYRVCFAVLAIPAAVTILLLFYARNRFPNPENFEPETKETAPFRLNRTFIIYIIGISVFAAGFLDFPLITMHVINNGLMSSDELPLLYALAMGVDAVAAILCGYLYDRLGIATL
ncbi:MAG: MFS transporter, partial [Methanomethylophilus sp.]